MSIRVHIAQWRKGQAYNIMVHVLKLTSMMNRGLPRAKREGRLPGREKKLSAVTKTNQVIV